MKANSKGFQKGKLVLLYNPKRIKLKTNFGLWSPQSPQASSPAQYLIKIKKVAEVNHINTSGSKLWLRVENIIVIDQKVRNHISITLSLFKHRPQQIPNTLTQFEGNANPLGTFTEHTINWSPICHRRLIAKRTCKYAELKTINVL